jgi:hypothetical protein
MIATEVGGEYTLRFAIGNSQTQLRHVQLAWSSIKKAADAVLP